ncbi:hypothetical protein [Microbacterium sp. 11MF]|uniref:hypothetical protein n=1 Tax=Microbacterium sp. 11MF TaxID=1169146 RepID=UPI00035F038A|nr:hypothetical protein [Microbacterium sp. 11MF]
MTNEVRYCQRHDTDPTHENTATHGRYCTSCWARLDMPLTQAGEIAGHLVGNMITSGSAGTDKVDTANDSAPLPFNQAAFDDVNHLYATLVYWSGHWASILNQKPARVLAGSWRDNNGTIVGLPVGVTAARAAEAVGVAAHWLKIRLDAILVTTHTGDIDAMGEQLRDIWRMNARWPRATQAAYSQVPCGHDDCGARLAVWPPAFPGDSRRVVCAAGHFYAEDDYEALVMSYAKEQKEKRQEQAKTERIAQRLAEKYGIGAR